jgi:hypothetical protein
MSTETADEKRVVADEQLDTVEAHHGGIDRTADLDDNAKLASYKSDAIEAENLELNLGVWASVKAYPMAAWWAFVMSCTIVSVSTAASPGSMLTRTDHGVVLRLPNGLVLRHDHFQERVWRSEHR